MYADTIAGSIDLATLPWTLTGWRPNEWRLPTMVEVGLAAMPDCGPMPISLPGSVQRALRATGEIPDWEIGTNSRQCEWVEHRHWLVECDLPPHLTNRTGNWWIRCDGLDHAGYVLMDRTIVGEFANSHIPHAFDLSAHIAAGCTRLGFVFTGHPRELGQFGWTSTTDPTKPRFSYGWDWVPRLVQTGVTGPIVLEPHDGPRLEELHVDTSLDPLGSGGRINIAGTLSSPSPVQVSLSVDSPNGDRLTQLTFTAEPGPLRRCVNLDAVHMWWPNGAGTQPLYTVVVTARDSHGNVRDSHHRAVGFRTVDWEPCTDAAADALGWICIVNDRKVFLQGFNWVPLSPTFADLKDSDYKARLDTYRDLGVNVLRVWGGATIENPAFYRYCDELGLLVWQDFPLSSSGLENWPPDDPATIAQVVQIATSYLHRLRHHPCILLWCGGNELQGGADGTRSGIGRPVNAAHPLIAALSRAVNVADPERRFLPTSPTGPRFTADAREFGMGVHHEVHGPWTAPASWSEWARYWADDDALFRSEVGVAGASSVELITHAGGVHTWPPTANGVWAHSAAMWVAAEWPIWQSHRAEMQPGPDTESLTEFVEWSQRRQAVFVSHAARRCKQRFPACGGVLVWMGHDCFPCPISTAAIDSTGQLKPVAAALARVFRADADSLTDSPTT